MKKRLLYLISLVLVITTLSSCGPPSATIVVKSIETTDNVSPISEPPRPSALSEHPTSPESPESPESPKPSESPEPAVPADVSPIPVTPDPTLLTYDEAKVICSTWLDNHADLPSYAISSWEYESELPPPPTYSLFGEQYYEFYVSSHWDYTSEWGRTSGHSHIMLVHEETGELLSLFMLKPEGERLTSTVEPLDDWYKGDYVAYTPALLTADDAIAIYNAWLDDRIDEQAVFSSYRLNEQSYDIYVIFGEQYFCLHAEDESRYWYNILVHMETGDLLFMMTSDGMYPDTGIGPLDDWYDSW